MHRYLSAAVTLTLVSCTSLPLPEGEGRWHEGVAFTPIANAREVAARFIMGTPDAGLYTIRVQIAPGGLMPPHRHPDERHITVLSGDLYYGYGETADPMKVRRYPAGSYFIVPANEPHFAIGISGGAVYQESGLAPTATRWVSP